MPYTDTPLASDTLNWSEIQTNLDDFRTWANAVPASDVNTGAVEHESIVRPVIRGFPLDGIDAETAGAFFYELGVGGPDVAHFPEWGPLPERLVIIPRVTNGITEYVDLSIGRSFYLSQSRDVTAILTMQWSVAAATTVVYPDGAGAGNTGGWFVLCVRNRETGVVTEYGPSTQHVYPFDTGSNDVRFDHGIMCYVGTLSSAWYDLFVRYYRGAAPDDMHQIDITRAQLTIEVF